jgi:hypothetical protein
VGGSYDPHLALQPRRTFALLGPVLADGRAWAYGEPAAAIAELSSHYRTDIAALDSSLPMAPDGAAGVLPAEEAEKRLRASLLAARKRLMGLGYRPVEAGAVPDFVVSLALTWDDAGGLATVGVYVGAEVEGRFNPERASFVIEVPGEDPCRITAAELAGLVVGALPGHDPQGEL